MAFKPKQTNRFKKRGPKKTIVKVSKPLRRAIAQVMSKKVETKTINCRDPNYIIPSNTSNLAYTAALGMQYLVNDVFRQPQGVQDSTVLMSSNRIGDKVQGVGLQLNYYFHSRNNYAIGATSYQIPFVKIRVIVFRTAFGTVAPIYPLVYDTNILPVSTYTLQPINWDEGYIKEVLYDDVIILRNERSTTDSVSNPNTQSAMNNVYHLKKYIKFDRPIKYMDNNNASDSTDKPIFVGISAEVDDSFAGMVPSGTTLLYTTGYTQAWFKDA